MNKENAIKLITAKLQENNCNVAEEHDYLKVTREVIAYNPVAKKDVKGVGEIRVRFKSNPILTTVGSESRGQKLIALFEELGLSSLVIDDFAPVVKPYSEFYGAKDEESF